MGADGHVAIYDFSKLKEKYDEEFIDSFLGHFLSGKFYQQELSGKEYLTRYHGDNYQCDDLYDVIQNSYNYETDSFNTKHWAYSSCEADYFFKLDKEVRVGFGQMIKFLENECKINLLGSLDVSIYPVKLSEWYPPGDEMHDLTRFLVSLTRCLACGRRCRWSKAIGHHSLPFFGHGDLWCSDKCLNSDKKARPDRRRERRLRRKYKKDNKWILLKS
jgi:hypothetical protein